MKSLVQRRKSKNFDKRVFNVFRSEAAEQAKNLQYEMKTREPARTANVYEISSEEEEQLPERRHRKGKKKRLVRRSITIHAKENKHVKAMNTRKRKRQDENLPTCFNLDCREKVGDTLYRNVQIPEKKKGRTSRRI